MGAIDIVPSLLGACEVPLPDGLQGRDVSEVWRGEGVPDDTDLTPGASDSVFLMNMGNGWPNRQAWGGSLARRPNRALYLRPLVRERTRAPWLFDRHEDPLETRNIVDTAEARGAVEEMETRLHRWMEGTSESVRVRQTRTARVHPISVNAGPTRNGYKHISPA